MKDVLNANVGVWVEVVMVEVGRQALWRQGGGER